MKRVLCVLLILALFINNATCAVFAHPKASDHDKELEKVLFEDGYSKYQSDEIKNNILALEYASYLTIDQFKGDGKDKYDELKALGKGSLPSFSEIDYSEYPSKEGGVLIGPNNHRKITHQGWDQDGKSKEVQNFWDKRKKVLLETVEGIFDFSFITWFGYDEKCKAFSGLVYYVHILGDYDEADNYKKLAPLYTLAGRKDGKDIITDLRGYIKTLFDDQQKSTHYKELMDGLDDIEKKVNPLVNSIGGVNTDDEFEEYHQYSVDLMGLLSKHIPKLLKKEDNSKKEFYPGK